MKVSTTQPFQLVYSLFEHQYLGYLFDSFVVQRNSKGELTYQHQNISSQNAREFGRGMNEVDYELIELIDAIQQETIVKKFYNKKIKTNEFFLKVYDPEKGDTALQETIANHIKVRQAKILSMLEGKMVFEMGARRRTYLEANQNSLRTCHGVISLSPKRRKYPLLSYD